MSDPFAELSAPAYDAEAVTPSNTTLFTREARALYIGGDGNAVVLTAAGNAVTFSGLTAGTILPIRCRRVNSTSTTATNIVALF
jgi:hypothetical protein